MGTPDLEMAGQQVQHKEEYSTSEQCATALDQLHTARKKIAEQIQKRQNDLDDLQGEIAKITSEIEGGSGRSASEAKRKEIEQKLGDKRRAVTHKKEEMQAARDAAGDVDKVDAKLRTQQDREKLKKRSETLAKLKPEMDKLNAEMSALMEEQRKFRDAQKPTDDQKQMREDLFAKRSQKYDLKKAVATERVDLQKERDMLSEKINELTERRKKFRKNEYYQEKEERDAWWWDMSALEQKVWYDMDEGEREAKTAEVRARMKQTSSKSVAQ